MRQTHTYALMDVSKKTHDEIKGKLLEAGYSHAVHKEPEGMLLDMHGIALQAAQGEPINNTISPWMPERNPLTVAMIGKLGEEASELAQRCFRILIQGLEERDPDSKRLNSEELAREMSDVAACMHVVHEKLKIYLMLGRRDDKVAGFDRWHKMMERMIRVDRENFDELVSCAFSTESPDPDEINTAAFCVGRAMGLPLKPCRHSVSCTGECVKEPDLCKDDEPWKDELDIPEHLRAASVMKKLPPGAE